MTALDTSSGAGRVLVVTGFRREAALASSGRAIRTVVGGGRSDLLARRLSDCDPSDLVAVVSFGLAGGLDPDLRPGDLVMATAVIGAGRRYEASPSLLAAWARSSVDVRSRRGAFAGVDAPVLDPGAKAELRAATGAIAVDMESHLAADYAARHGLPFGILRAVSDGASHALPPVAARAMRPDGGIDVAAVLTGLIRDPRQIPALVRAGRDAGRAFRTLKASRRLLDALVEEAPPRA